MKIAVLTLVGLMIIFLGVQIYGFMAQEASLGKDLADIEARLTKAKADETNLQTETQYLANPINLEKELRARFNLKKPGEKMIIIVPGSTSTPTSTH